MIKKYIIPIVFVILITSSTHACCIISEDFEETLYDSYDTIFIGKEKSRTSISIGKEDYKHDPFQNNITVKLEVLNPIKGTMTGDIITVQTSDNSSCGFSIGDSSGLVYLGRANNHGIYNAICCNQITPNDTDRFNRTLNTLYYKINNPFMAKISRFTRQIKYQYRSISTRFIIGIQDFMTYFHKGL